MLQQLMTENRFVSLAPDDPDNSDTDPEVTEPRSANKPQDEGSSVSDDTVYYDAQDDTPYFSTKPGSIETNPTLVVEVSNVKLISI